MPETQTQISADSSFQELHPYGLSEGQLQGALFTLLGLMLFCILAYILTALSQIREYGRSARTLMGMKPHQPDRVKREREARAEIKRIVERQRSNNV